MSDDVDEQVDYHAFANRIKFHQLTEGYNKDSDIFPYSEADFAKYMLDRLMKYKDRQIEVQGLIPYLKNNKAQVEAQSSGSFENLEGGLTQI